MRRSFSLLVVATVALLACDDSHTVQPEESINPIDRSGLAQFGRLLGSWHIEQQVRQQDGSWLPGSSADWEFSYALGGHAIQDIWTQPPLSREVATPAARQFGTNIRLYDAQNNVWNIVWASSDQASFTTYVASATETGEMVMVGDDADRPGTTQRITYFNIGEDSWDWKMEFSNDGESWIEVARTQAVRKAP